MSVVSFRVPKELKEKMKRIGINWSEELGAYIEKRVKEHEQKEAIEEFKKIIAKIPQAPKGTAVKLVREDRDSD